MKDSNSYDFFDYVKNDNGSFSVTKNGEFFLLCTGSESDVMSIVETLKNDVLKEDA